MGYYYICSGCKKRYPMGFSSPDYPSTISFCTECGKDLIKNCTKCKKEIAHSNESFCPHCGTKYVG